MMRAAMVATLFATACGTAELETDEAPGGDRAGSGTVFQGSISFEHRIDAVVDGSRWWVGTTSPTISGTYAGAKSPAVKVSVGNFVTSAEIRPGGWSVELPEGSIGASDTMVTATLEDAGRGTVETKQVFAYDAVGPMIALQPSLVFDEQRDVVDFSSGEPVHTTSTFQVDLGGEGCPIVRKYAYLMDASVPYGKRDKPNPLAWSFTLDDERVDPASPMVRVRLTDGTTVMDWKPLQPPGASGIYTVALTRQGGAFPVQQVGTHNGVFFLDVRASDWSGNETTKSWCWDNEPLQPPIEVAQLAKAALFSISLPQDTPAVQVMTGGGVELASQTITQLTADPTTFTWSVTTGAISYAKTTFDGYAIEEKSEDIFCLNGTTDPKCAATFSGAATAGEVSSGGSVSPQLSIAVIDVATDAVIQTSGASASPSVVATLPGRAAGAPPHEYKFVVRAASMPELAPPSLGTSLGDYAFLGLAYTGTPAQFAGVHCTTFVQTQWGPMCRSVAYHYRLSALDHVTLTMTPRARIDQNDGTLGGWGQPFTWDSGDDDLPGAY